MPFRRSRPLLRAAISEDHYYWLTSYLAVRGLQTMTCRLVATTMFGLSAIPLLLMFSAAGPSGPVNRGFAVAVSICSVVMAMVWLRPTWPSRLASISCVLVGSICVAVACLIESNPALGIMGNSAFIALSAFAALFHDLRLVSVTWVAGVFTLIGLATQLGVDDLAVTASGITLFILTNVFVVFVCRSVIGLVDKEFHYSELDPLTGLLTREAFTDRVATLFSARDRTDDRFAAVIVVNLDSFSLLTAMSGETGANQARVVIGHRIGETLRRDAVLAHVGESEYLVADTFTSSDASVLTDRIQQTVVTAPFRLSASIGVVTTPLAPLVGLPPHDVVDELIALAASNMYAARRAGGQRTEASRCPRLSSVEAEDQDSDGPF